MVSPGHWTNRFVAGTSAWMSLDEDRHSKPEQALEEEVDFLRRDNVSLQRRLDKALAENERLRKELEEALRSLKRQAAPFSKGNTKSDPSTTMSQIMDVLEKQTFAGPAKILQI
jgi:predicted  nucleic acid-binding Zn-ribbon protein